MLSMVFTAMLDKVSSGAEIMRLWQHCSCPYLVSYACIVIVHIVCYFRRLRDEIDFIFYCELGA